jgi:hypothetical protein
MNYNLFFKRDYRYIYAVGASALSFFLFFFVSMALIVTGQVVPRLLIVLMPVLVWRYFVKRDYTKRKNIGFWIGKEAKLLMTNWGKPMWSYSNNEALTFLVYEHLEQEKTDIPRLGIGQANSPGSLQEFVQMEAIYSYSIFKFDGSGKVLDITSFLHEGKYTSFDAVADWPKFMHDMRYINN